MIETKKSKIIKEFYRECKHKPYRDKDNNCWYCAKCENYLGCADYTRKELMEQLKHGK